MKTLILSIIVILVISCGNKKAEIVEQINSYKDSIRIVDMAELALKRTQDSLRQSFSDSMRVDFDSKNMDELRSNNNRNVELLEKQTEATILLSREQFKRKSELKIKRSVFKARIDSLELELKKY